MVQTDNEFQMLMSKLDELVEGQRGLREEVQKLHGSDANIRERLAALESKQERYVTFRMLVTTGIGATGVGAGAGHLITRVFGG